MTGIVVRWLSLILFLLAVRRVFQQWWIRHEKLSEASSWLYQLRDRLTMNRALKFLIEIRESIGRILFGTEPPFVDRSQSAVNQLGLCNLLCAALVTAAFLFDSTPFFEHGEIWPFVSPSSASSPVVSVCTSLSRVHLIVRHLGHAILRETNVSFCSQCNRMTSLEWRLLHLSSG